MLAAMTESNQANEPRPEQPGAESADQPTVQPPHYGYPAQPAYSSAQDYPHGDAYSGYQPPSYHTEPLPPSSPAFGPYAPPASPPAKHPTRTILVAAVLAALIGGGVGAGTVALADNNNGTSVSSLSTTTSSAPIAAKIDGTIGAAAAKIRPSVVTIWTSPGRRSPAPDPA